MEGANAVRLSQDFEDPDQDGVWTEVGFDARIETGEDGESAVVVTSRAPAIDMPGESGTPILAAESGTVRETGSDAERGNYLILDHGDGLTTLYAQCREILVTEGQSVAAGDPVAEMGSTGRSTGPHLHFAVLRGGVGGRRPCRTSTPGPSPGSIPRDKPTPPPATGRRGRFSLGGPFSRSSSQRGIG